MFHRNAENGHRYSLNELCTFSFLLGLLLPSPRRETFIRNFFTRTFIMDDLLKKIRELILQYQADPNNIQKIRNKLNDGSKDIILLLEVLEYVPVFLSMLAWACALPGLVLNLLRTQLSVYALGSLKGYQLVSIVL